jgi:hypothetical protein
LMSPVMLAKVKLRSSTLELFGRSTVPALPWSMYVWVMKTGKVTLWMRMLLLVIFVSHVVFYLFVLG